ncbi:MAG: MAPEG family protein [Nannocystaceae bacterium]
MTSKQQGVLRGMLAALALVLGGLGLAVALRPAALLPDGDDPGSRLAWAAAWLLPAALCLVITIGRLARHRFRTPDDIDGSGLTQGTEDARLMQAVLQNTLEQVLLAALTYGAYAARMPRGWLAALPAAAALFLVGRLLFIAGYRRGAPGRALGFALTFYSSVVLAIAALVAAIGRLAGA